MLLNNNNKVCSLDEVSSIIDVEHLIKDRPAELLDRRNASWQMKQCNNTCKCFARMNLTCPLKSVRFRCVLPSAIEGVYSRFLINPTARTGTHLSVLQLSCFLFSAWHFPPMPENQHNYHIFTFKNIYIDKLILLNISQPLLEP